MARGLSREMSRFFAQASRPTEFGFVFRTRRSASAGTMVASAASIRCQGERLPAELIVVGIGVIPNVELPAEAGLYVENGVKTDQALLTSDPAISTVGDCRASPIRRRVFPRAWNRFRTRRITRVPWRRG